MLPKHMYKIGTRLKEVIQDLLEAIAAEYAEDEPNSSDTVSRIATLPTVDFRKRRAKSEGIRVGEGITIIPRRPTQVGGTNERDDTGYVFLVVIATGTYSSEIYENWSLAIYEQEIRRRLNQRRIGVDLQPHACELATVTQPGELPDDVNVVDDRDFTVLQVTTFVRESRRNEL